MLYHPLFKMFVLTDYRRVGDHVGVGVVKAGDGVLQERHGCHNSFGDLGPEEVIEHLGQGVAIGVALTVGSDGSLARQAPGGHDVEQGQPPCSQLVQLLHCCWL